MAKIPRRAIRQGRKVARGYSPDSNFKVSGQGKGKTYNPDGGGGVSPASLSKGNSKGKLTGKTASEKKPGLQPQKAAGKKPGLSGSHTDDPEQFEGTS